MLRKCLRLHCSVFFFFFFSPHSSSFSFCKFVVAADGDTRCRKSASAQNAALARYEGEISVGQQIRGGLGCGHFLPGHKSTRSHGGGNCIAVLRTTTCDAEEFHDVVVSHSLSARRHGINGTVAVQRRPCFLLSSRETFF